MAIPTLLDTALALLVLSSPSMRTKEGETSIISLPLIAMDSAIALRFGTDFEIAIDSMVHHLSVVGGTFSLLFHPGMFANPEHPETMGMYERILEIFQKYGAVSMTPLSILGSFGRRR